MSESATTEHARIQTARSIVNVCLDGVDHDVIKVVFYILLPLFITLLFTSLIYN